MADIEISVVTPMYNEQDCIREFHSRVSAVLEEMGEEYEIVIIDDGSRDRTPAIIRELSAEDPHVQGVLLARNRGQSTATYAGLQQSRGRCVVVMDGDLQNRPEDIPLLIARLREGYDLVSAGRQRRVESKYLRLIPSRTANWMIRRASGCDVRDMGGCSVMKGEMARSLKLREGHHRIIPALVYRLGGAVAEVPVQHATRYAGTSHYGLGRMVDVLFDIVTLWFQTSFKQRPVYLFGRIALTMFVVATLTWIYLLWAKLFSGMPMANRPAFFAGILLYLASLGFLATGFILEAIYDTFESVTRTKPYVIRTVVRDGRDSEECFLDGCSPVAREKGAGAAGAGDRNGNDAKR